MDWKDYEEEIFQTFKNAYPDADVTFDAKVQGRYSKEERQIDLLVEGRIAGSKIRIVVDGKYYNKNIDVKHVEAFIAMVEDVDAHQGILVTSKGYSSAAINRAYYGPKKSELDILSFEELKQFQGFGGVTYSGSHGALLPAPFGWIVDGTKSEFGIATLYQRGKTLKEAQRNGEWMYMNISKYDEQIRNLDELIEFHEINTKSAHPTATFEYETSIKRKDGHRTKLRKILRDETPLHEYTGLVDFETYCVFCVLFTPEELHIKNIRKLEYIIENLHPIDVNRQSIADSEIQKREHLIEETDSEQEKAEILISIGNIYRDIDEKDKAIEKYQESIKLFPFNYGARLALLELCFGSSERNKVMDDFFELDPTARQIHDNLVRLALEHGAIDIVEEFFIDKLEQHKTSHEILGNIYFALGDLYYSIDNNSKSLVYFFKSELHFKECFPKNHPARKSLVSIIKAIK